MHPDAAFIGKVFLAFTVVCIFLVYAGMRKLASRSGDHRLTKVPNRFLTIVVVWMVILFILSVTGFTSNFSSTPPRMFILLFLVFAVVLTLVVSGKTDAMLRVTPYHWLVNIQSFRIVVELILWWMSVEYFIPEQMTFEGLNLDILAGLSAPVIYLVIKRDPASSRKTLLIWNIISLLLLVNIVTIAILSLPTQFRAFMNEPSSFILTQFPFILLPGILVPLAYSMHFLSLRKLFIERQSN